MTNVCCTNFVPAYVCMQMCKQTKNLLAMGRAIKPQHDTSSRAGGQRADHAFWGK